MFARTTLLLLCFVAAVNGFAADQEPLVSLRQNFDGLGARTWELILKADGTVVEEQYDIYAHNANSIDIIKRVRKVPHREIQRLVARAAELTKNLPFDVGEQTFVDPVTKAVREVIVADPETKAIRFSVNDQKHLVGWSSYESTPPTDKTEEFQRAWETLRAALLSPDA